MRPIDIDIMLHHYVCASRYHTPSGEATKTENELVEKGMLAHIGIPVPPLGEKERSGYEITIKGRVYMEALKAVPVPVTMHVVRWPEEPQVLEEK